MPAGQDALLFGWLKALYPIWARYEPEDIFVSAQLGLAELALSGCTMSSDHLYLFPNGARLEDTIEAAGTVGIRFHPTRGAMSVGESAGGLPPDSVVEAEPAILTTWSGWWTRSTTPRRARWCGWGWRPARPSRSRRG